MKQLSLKIALGYIAIIGILFGAIYYINKQATILTTGNGIEEYVMMRRSACDNLISLTLTSEAYGQVAGMGDKESFNKYIATLNEIDTTLNSLDSLIADSTIKSLIDSLAQTITIKATIIKDLHNISNTTNSSEYQKRIAQLLSQYNDIGTHTHVITTTIKEEKSTTVTTPRKNVFKRIAAIFNPGSNDSTTTTSISSTSDTTSTYIDNSESFNNEIAQINASSLKKQSSQALKLRNKIEALRAANGNLSLRVSSLIRDIEQSEEAVRTETLQREQEIKQHSIKITISIAIIATIIALIFFIIIWRDITRSNRYRHELEIARQQAEELLEAREKLMLTITHDIKAPTGAIIGYTELIEQSHPTSGIAEYVKNINHSAAHLLNLVSALLDYHRLDAGEIEITPSKFHLSTTLHDIVKSFIPTSQKKGLELNINTSPSTNCVINCDQFRLRQILENLISNAIKFTDNGAITISASIIESTLNVSVTDTGKGISKIEQARIFDEFTRLKNAQGIEGSGLGLSITSKLVDLLGGTMSLTSEVGKGSTFAFSIPIEIGEECDNNATANGSIIEDSTTTFSKPISKHLEIIIIDDDPIQLKYTYTMLQNIEMNCKIHCYAVAQEGIEAAQAIHPDIIFTDIQMPHLSGFDVVNQVRRSLPTIPIIAMTASNNINPDEYINKGFSDILPKPYQRQQLFNIIQHFFGDCDIDLTQITQFADNDEEIKTLLLTTTLDETTKNGEAITKAIETKDKSTVCAIAHKMLPLISMVKIQGIEAFEHFNNQRGNNEWNENDSQQSIYLLETISKLIYHLKDSISS